MKRLRWLGAGVAAAAGYFAALAFTMPGPGSLLYDGLAPLPPYRWVHAPVDRARDNQPPQPGTGTLALGAQGSPAAEVSTPDDQALVTFPAAVIAPHSGETSVKATVTPLDAASIAPAITGQTFDSNGYRIDAVYAASGEPAVLTGPVTVVLRYAVHATQMLRNQDKAWLALPGTRFDGTQQLLATSPRLGVFVAGAGARKSRGAPGGPAAPVAAGAGGIAAVMGRRFMPPRGRRGSGGERRAAGGIIRVPWIEPCRRNRG